jgi:hypothetical protein
MATAPGALPPKHARDDQRDRDAQEDQEAELLGAGGETHKELRIEK